MSLEVVNDDGSRTYEVAMTWLVSTSGHLRLFDSEGIPVAEYAPGVWDIVKEVGND